MTGTLRSSARNPIAIVIMGFLILVFLVIGVGGNGKFPDLLRMTKPDAVVSAGSHSMTARDYEKVFDQQKQKLQEQNQGQTFTNLFLAQNGFDQQLLQAIAQDELLAELLGRIGIAPGPKLIDQQIQKLPFAFDPVTGKFSQARFTQALAAQGITPAQAQVELTDELAERHFVAALSGGFHAPRIFAAVTAVTALENRDVSWFMLNPNSVPKPTPPTDAQLGDFIRAHTAQLMRPEMRTISLVRFSAAAIAPTIPVDPADVQKTFEAQKDTLTNPETRTVVEIPVRDAGQAAAAAARLKAGEEPNAIAKAIGAQAILYADKPATAIADHKVAAIAFQLPAGSVQGPIQGDLGAAVIKVVSVTPPKPVTLETTRAKITDDLRQKAARDKAYKQSQAFDDARTGGANIQAAATKAGAQVQSIGPFTADGRDANGKPIAGLDPKIVKEAFARRPGDDADLEDLGQGEYYALKVDKIAPPALPRIEDARPQLTAAYLQLTFLDALRAKANALVARLKAGESIATVASSVGGHVTNQTGMRRVDAAKYQALGSQFLQAAFGVRPGDAFAAAGPTGVYIAKLDAIRPGDPRQVADVTNAFRDRIGEGYLNDVLAASKAAAAAQVKPQINRQLALQAIGVDPTQVAKAKGK